MQFAEQLRDRQTMNARRLALEEVRFLRELQQDADTQQVDTSGRKRVKRLLANTASTIADTHRHTPTHPLTRPNSHRHKGYGWHEIRSQGIFSLGVKPSNTHQHTPTHQHNHPHSPTQTNTLQIYMCCIG